ncbi:hypothetical protein [Actinomadura rubrisoli]|nr:hypothetical protein [Actinomadura rubrisoli]
MVTRPLAHPGRVRGGGASSAPPTAARRENARRPGERHARRAVVLL